MRLREFIKLVKRHGITVEKPSSGSHWKLKKAGARTYTVPAHNGEKTELDEVYIAGACRNFGLDRSDLDASGDAASDADGMTAAEIDALNAAIDAQSAEPPTEPTRAPASEPPPPE